jgi:hypothetical protein
VLPTENSGEPLLLEALRDIYIPRIQRGNISFAANVLSARGALLSALAHFFERGDWGSAFETSAEGQRLTAEDQLFIFMQAGQYLAATRGLPHPRRAFATNEPNPCAIRLIVPCLYMRH